jgi:nitrous oxidase accessory protein
MKSVDHTTVAGNSLVGNEVGLYLYNSNDNVIVRNRIANNDEGVYLAAGSVNERIHHNAFVDNVKPVTAVVGEQVYWNASDTGNYWSDAPVVDIDDDGVSETRYQPAGFLERTVRRHPSATVFAHGPAADAIRVAQRSVPIVESDGVVDAHPLTRPPDGTGGERRG